MRVQALAVGFDRRENASLWLAIRAWRVVQLRVAFDKTPTQCENGDQKTTRTRLASVQCTNCKIGAPGS
jgi:hypothetical protein